MATAIDRRWWPFPLQDHEPQAKEAKAKLAFLEEAARRGLRGFIDRSDCGAVAEDGRECYLAWRGKQRCELRIIESGIVRSRKMFVDPVACVAFQQAAEEALESLAPAKLSHVEETLEGKLGAGSTSTRS